MPPSDWKAPWTPDLSSTVEELQLFAENTGELYNQKKSILKNILRKMGSGKYDPAKAPALWMYWVEAAAKRYCKENCSPYDKWNIVFPMDVRKQLAKKLAKEEHAELLIQHPELASGVGEKVATAVRRIIKSWK
jgi:hypothetical protein